MVGDMTTPRLGRGDLLIVSAGPGPLPSTAGFLQVARDAGARTLPVTAPPQGRAARLAAIVTVIPAPTMADDRGGQVSVRPMGSLFETAPMIVFDLVVRRLRDWLGETAWTMRARHSNLA